MNNNKINIDNFDVLRRVSDNSKTSQRELANNLGFSLGKLNYCLQALKSKGLIKISNFKKKKNKKIKYFQYMLTPKGLKLRIKLTTEFMKKKMKEYNQLKKELKKNI